MSVLVRPSFLVCEDGNEYLERFERFLGEHYDFLQSKSWSALVAQLPLSNAAALLLDLDFRRTALARLIDVEGHPLADASTEQRKHLIANQGIAIATALRRTSSQLPVLLFADLPASQQAYLQQQLAPLEVISSHSGLKELQEKLETLLSSRR